MIKCQLRSTDGRVIDLLNPKGFMVCEWTPSTTALKGDGVRVESRVMESDVLVGGAYGNVAESLRVTVNEVEAAGRIRELEALLVDAVNWALSSWQDQLVYLEVQWDEDSHVKYCQVVAGSFQFGNNVYGYHRGLANNTLVIERKPYWLGAVPGYMLGPLTNWIVNPSFEYWYHGYATAGAYPLPIPVGWYQAIVAGARPPDAYIRREDTIVAGPNHSLQIGFESASECDWRLQTWIVIPDPHYVLTLRFWLYLRGDLVNHTFGVFLADTAGTIYHEEQFTAEFTGWHHVTFSIVPSEHEFILGVRWQIAAVGNAAYAIVDRMVLMDSEMDEADWPDSQFYLTCTAVWNWEDWLSFWCEKEEPDHPCQHLNYFDVVGVPGNADALMRLSLSRLGELYGDEDLNLRQLLVAQRRRYAADRSLNVDPDGYTGLAVFADGASSESMVTSPITGGEDWRDVCFKHVDSAYEATRFAGRFRVFARVRWTSDEQEPTNPTEIRLTYWVGTPEQTIALDTVELDDGAYFTMINLTPKSVMDWLPTGPSDPGAFFGLIVQARNYVDGETPSGESGDVEIDFLLLAALDNGLMWVTFPDDAPMLPSQAVVLDSNSRGVQMSQSTPAGTWVWDSTLTRIENLKFMYWQAMVAYMGGLYVGWQDVGGNNVVARYDNEGWTDTAFPGVGASTANFITFDDRLMCSYGDDLYSYHTLDGWTLEASTPSTNSVRAIGSFGGWLWVADSQSNIYRWDGRANIVLDNAFGVVVGYTRLLGYQGRLWFLENENVHVYEHLTGWRSYTDPVVAPVVLSDAAVYLDYLFVAATTGVFATNGDGNWHSRFTSPGGLVLARGPSLCVYDGYLYVLYFSTTTGTLIYRTGDGMTWEQIFLHKNMTAQGIYVSAYSVYGGRMAFGFFSPSLEAIVWHQNALVLGGTPPHSGRAMTLRHTETNRQYVMMEVWEPQLEGDPLPNCDVTPCTGPRLFCHVWLVPRWLSVRGEI